MLNHGGKLNEIAQQFNIPVEQWLDLSTGISPFTFPIPDIPQAIWRALPQQDFELIELAKSYYQGGSLTPLSGSQSGIQVLPKYRLRAGYPLSRVWLPKQGYKEHEKAWRDSGFCVCHYNQLAEIVELRQFDIVVVINPNNPTGAVTPIVSMLALHEKLSNLQGWLVVDEAFMDGTESEDSMMPYSDSEFIFVLRSMGKFFGLAGMRVGFIASEGNHLAELKSLLGPWHINGPASFIAKKALADRAWQQRQKIKLTQASNELHGVLSTEFETEVFGTSLFKTVYLPNAKAVYHSLCEQGVYVRLTDEQDALRFGIPTQEQMIKLKFALTKLSCAS